MLFGGEWSFGMFGFIVVGGLLALILSKLYSSTDVEVHYTLQLRQACISAKNRLDYAGRILDSNHSWYLPDYIQVIQTISESLGEIQMLTSVAPTTKSYGQEDSEYKIPDLLDTLTSVRERACIQIQQFTSRASIPEANVVYPYPYYPYSLQENDVA